jgi:hypothetical protein
MVIQKMTQWREVQATVKCSAKMEMITSGSFDDDLIVAGAGNDHMFGDFGDDVLVGGPGADYFSCGDGMDIVFNLTLMRGTFIPAIANYLNKKVSGKVD